METLPPAPQPFVAQQHSDMHPVSLNLPYPPKSSRLLALALLLMFVKPLMLIPHLVCMYVLMGTSFLGIFFGQVAVLFTGTYPKPFFALAKGNLAWQTRVNAYLFGLTDTYPPFGFEIEEGDAAVKGFWITFGVMAAVVVLVIGLSIVSSSSVQPATY